MVGRYVSGRVGRSLVMRWVFIATLVLAAFALATYTYGLSIWSVECSPFGCHFSSLLMLQGLAPDDLIGNIVDGTLFYGFRALLGSVGLFVLLYLCSRTKSVVPRLIVTTSAMIIIVMLAARSGVIDAIRNGGHPNI
jgi:hypothetical protein